MDLKLILALVLGGAAYYWYEQRNAPKAVGAVAAQGTAAAATAPAQSTAAVSSPISFSATPVSLAVAQSGEGFRPAPAYQVPVPNPGRRLVYVDRPREQPYSHYVPGVVDVSQL